MDRNGDPPKQITGREVRWFSTLNAKGLKGGVTNFMSNHWKSLNAPTAQTSRSATTLFEYRPARLKITQAPRRTTAHRAE